MTTTSGHISFPRLQARNLNGRSLTLPAGFGGVRNLVLVTFRRWHQDLVDSWMPYFNQLLTQHAELQVYELPIIDDLYSFTRPLIDGGMAAAIADRAVRERTMTVYTNVERVLADLKIVSTSTMTVLLVDRSGQIFWRDVGGYGPERVARLEQALAAPIVPPEATPSV